MSVSPTSRNDSSEPASDAQDIATRVGGWLAAAGFPAVRNTEAEFHKLALLRVFVALLALNRMVEIALTSRLYFDPDFHVFGMAFTNEAVLAYAICALLVLLAAGVFTPLTCLALLLLYTPVDDRLHTWTLGTGVFMALLLLLLLGSGGRRLSVDARLAAGNGRIGRGVRTVYGIFGSPNSSQLTLLYFVAFFSYAMVSINALAFHLSDPVWRAGDTIEVLLTSSYLSHFWEQCRWLQQHAPWLLTTFSHSSVVAQTTWQLLMLPLAFMRWTRWWVIAHGIVFFAISAFVMQLSYLPWMEMALWAAIWIRVPWRRGPRMQVLYDDRCNLCAGTVRTLRAFDPLGTYEFVPLTQSQDLRAAHRLSEEQVLTDIHGIRGNRVVAGFAMYEAAARANPLLWPLVPLLLIARVTRLGPFAYRWVAARRRRLFGTCDLSATLPTTPWARLRAGWRVPAVTIGAVWLLVIMASPLANIPLRHQLREHGVQVGAEPDEAIFKTVHRFGVQAPNVFNIVDLRMGDSWAVIWRVNADGTRSRVPSAGADGQRLEYMDSDIMYFGNDLNFRRTLTAPGVTTDQIFPGTTLYEWLRALARYDQRLHGPAERYDIDIFETHGSNMDKPAPQRYRPRKTFELSFSGKQLED